MTLDSCVVSRRKSIYPGAADEAYERAIDAQLRDLLWQVARRCST
jgi:hypothetical protein